MGAALLGIVLVTGAACSSPDAAPPATTSSVATSGTTASPGRTTSSTAPGPAPTATTATTAATAGPPATGGTGDAVRLLTPLCARLATTLSTIFNSGPPTQAVFDEGTAALRDVTGQIRAVPPPPGREAAVGQLADALDAFTADLQAAAPAVIAGDQAGEQSIQARVNADHDAVEAAARALGLRACLG
jgi:hypothetical protein